MFDSSNYKKIAREQLKNRWKVPCLVTFIVILVDLCLSAAGESANSTVSGIAGLVSVAATGIFNLAAMELYVKLFRSGDKITFENFTNSLEHWLKGILSWLWFTLWTVLWSLLFLIPGIIKSVSYSMMFYVLAEYPEMSVAKAMKISKVLTSGHKADLVGMWFSFIGWFLLSCITCGIGFVFLIPYCSMSYTNAYFDLKRMAFQEGRLTPADF